MLSNVAHFAIALRLHVFEIGKELLRSYWSLSNLLPKGYEV